MASEIPGRVVVAGGSGLVGRALVAALTAQGLAVTVLSRRPEAQAPTPGVAFRDWEDLPSRLDGARALINLAGEGIADRRWTATRKAALRDSRVGTTRRLVAALRACAEPPEALVNASAIGFYGSRDETPVDEAAGPGAGFLPDTCRAWEAEAAAASAGGTRVVRLRLGVVLAREGGALPRMALPVRWFQGCRLGSGRQGLSWIHRDDLVAMLIEAARDSAWEGALNATAPAPLSQEAFTRLLALRLHRPMLPVPGPVTAAALRLALGELAESLLLQGAYVRPARALALGFRFRFPTAEAALADLL